MTGIRNIKNKNCFIVPKEKKQELNYLDVVSSKPIKQPPL